MEFEITTWFVEEFSNTVYHLAQQKTTRAWSFCRQETQNSKMKHFDRIDGTETREKQSRNEDTPNMEMTHYRRNVILRDYDWATLVDDVDKIRMLNMPTSEYVIEAKWAFNRRKDLQFIKQFSAVAMTGENGDGTVAFDYDEKTGLELKTQRIAASDGTGFSALNVRTLRKIRAAFRKNEVISDDGDDKTIHLLCNSDDLDNLLADDKLTNQDYATVKALVDGETDYFMGIRFHHSEQLKNLGSASIKFAPTTGKRDDAGTSSAGFRTLLAWVPSGMIASTGEEIKARISERDDKCYSVQPYVKMSVGAVRMDEKKCMEIYVDPSKEL